MLAMSDMIFFLSSAGFLSHTYFPFLFPPACCSGAARMLDDERVVCVHDTPHALEEGLRRCFEIVERFAYVRWRRITSTRRSDKG